MFKHNAIRGKNVQMVSKNIHFLIHQSRIPDFYVLWYYNMSFDLVPFSLVIKSVFNFIYTQ